ncbi:hypothetical protein [Marinobacterium rhizophilum]|uniref:Uncharacterized protein n=1 Tax=Marinobacterium rhizophilum TaxID=420402 RepID=A0ABY5HRQ5_9GAMM|nr:hypothetical protein [Marinobacterium rhizophilum]UTW14238.1 hypothetical protein KDW95_11600 [Marinobacterium rhizophilum]
MKHSELAFKYLSKKHLTEGWPCPENDEVELSKWIAENLSASQAKKLKDAIRKTANRETKPSVGTVQISRAYLAKLKYLSEQFGMTQTETLERLIETEYQFYAKYDEDCVDDRENTGRVIELEAPSLAAAMTNNRSLAAQITSPPEKSNQPHADKTSKNRAKRNRRKKR